MLEEKRQKIRLIQQRKVSEKELVDFKDLPLEIPLTLSIGHRVYSHICQPEEGVFLGTIAAVDPCEHTYRVVFDRASLGSQTVYDFEIKSVVPVQTIPVKAYVQTYRPKLTSTTGAALINQTKFFTPTNSQIANTSNNSQLNLLIDDLNSINAINNPAFAALLLQSNLDPMLGIGSPFKLDSLGDLSSQFQTPLASSAAIVNGSGGAGGVLGGFPIRLLLMITRLNKILNIKRETVGKLSSLNAEAERMRAQQQAFSKEFQSNYAVLVLDLEKLNKDLQDYLNGVQRYCEELAPELKLSSEEAAVSEAATDANVSTRIEEIKQKLLSESNALVQRLNVKVAVEERPEATSQISDSLHNIDLNERPPPLSRRVKSAGVIELIARLTTLLLQIRESSSGGLFMPYCTRLINESVEEIKQSLRGHRSVALFEDKVQVHINHIQSTLCQHNKLHAFKYELNNNSAFSNQILNSLGSKTGEVQHQFKTENNMSEYLMNEFEPDEEEEDDEEDEEEEEEDEEDFEFANQPLAQSGSEEVELDNEEDTDDSFNATAAPAAAVGQTKCPRNRARLKRANPPGKQAPPQQQSKVCKSKKIAQSKRSHLNNLKSVFCSLTASNSSLP